MTDLRKEEAFELACKAACAKCRNPAKWKPAEYVETGPRHWWHFMGNTALAKPCMARKSRDERMENNG